MTRKEPYVDGIEDDGRKVYVSKPLGEILAQIDIKDDGVQVRYYISPKLKDSFTKEFDKFDEALKWVQEQWENR